MGMRSRACGCGGGGGGGDVTPIERGPSSDYFGLEVGSTLTYNISGYEAEETPSEYTDTLIHRILSDSHSIFKTEDTYLSDGYKSGEYIEKDADGNKYLYKGYWDNEGEHPSDPPYETIVSYPISTGSTSDSWGEAIRQETVTVPAGTFNAWVFHSYDSWSDPYSGEHIYEAHTYYVPYLGLIKRQYSHTKNGVEIFSSYVLLNSYSFGVSGSSLNSYNVNSRTTRPSTSSKKLKQLFKHHR